MKSVYVFGGSSLIAASIILQNSSNPDVNRQHLNPPYTTPRSNDPIKEFTALGDSYTAGIGSIGPDGKIPKSKKCDRFTSAYPYQMWTSNSGWPGEYVSDRKFNFGACSGDVIEGVRRNQLQDAPVVPYVSFGKPEIAVMTISGNDLFFSDIVKGCIYRPFFTNPDCETTLQNAESKVRDPAFRTQIVELLLDIVAKGRSSGGNSFQLFVNTYVPFFNDIDTQCDSVTWTFYYSKKEYALTTSFRKRMNTLVLRLNEVIKAAVARLGPNTGVFYVDGYQAAYVGHQYCEPAAGPVQNPIWETVYFWHSNCIENNNEGPSPPSADAQGGVVDASQDLSLRILCALMPDAVQRETVTSGQREAWDVMPNVFGSEERFETALKEFDARQSEGSHEGNGLFDQYFRVFHPKGTPYGIQAQRVLEFIRDVRNLEAVAK